MPKKTLALITGLVVVTIILFIIALRAGQQQQQAPSVPQGNTMKQQPTPMVPAHTVLKLGPNPLTVAAGQTSSVNITMDTSDNNVTAVQLELGYDPHIISNVKVTAGSLFSNPVVLINKNDPTAGRYTYAFGITPSAPAVKGQGVVATVSFITLPGTTGKSMQLGLLPTSLVTARGVAQSVLNVQKTTGTVITVGSAANAPIMMHTATGTGATTTTAPAK
jgi:hypothetical protein